jgi:hypothetical protein
MVKLLEASPTIGRRYQPKPAGLIPQTIKGEIANLVTGGVFTCCSQWGREPRAGLVQRSMSEQTAAPNTKSFESGG